MLLDFLGDFCYYLAMEPELEKRLADIEELARENHSMLVKMRRGQVLASIFRAIYWLIVLGAGVASYYFVQPYINDILATYQKINSQISHFNSLLGR